MIVRGATGRAAGASPVRGISIRRRLVGGTRRLGRGGVMTGASGAGGAAGLVSMDGAGAAAAGAGTTSTSGSEADDGSSAEGASTTGATGSAGASGSPAGATASGISSGAAGPAAAGLMVLMSRGRSAGATGLTGSTGGLAVVLPADLRTGDASAKSGPFGSVICRFRAWRSTNCRATISSIELEALFTSMPVSCLSRAIASGLDIPSSSATLYILTVAKFAP